MYRFSRCVCSGLMIAASLSLSAGAAHAQEATASLPLSVDQVREAFSTAGYQVHQAQNWNWTSPPVTSFEVHDSSNGHMVMVLVYPSATAAEAALLEAETHEQALSAGTQTDAGGSPHLIAGYGRSVWNGNVAMVETTEGDIERAYQAQVDRDSGLSMAPQAPVLEYSVDLEFLQALQANTVNF